MLPKILSTRSDLLDLRGQGLLRRVTQDETTIDARLLTRARVNNEAGANLTVQTESREDSTLNVPHGKLVT